MTAHQMLLATGGVASPPTIDATANGSACDSTTMTWEHICSGSNRALIVVLGFSEFSNNLSSIKYNGVNMTLVAQIEAANTEKSAMYELINPDSGAHNVEAVFTSVGNRSSGVSISFNGANQTDFTGTPATATGNNTDPSVNVSSAANELVVDGLRMINASYVDVGAGQTFRDGGSDCGGGGAVISSEPGGTTVTMSHDLIASGGNWAQVGVSIKPP